MKPVIYAIIASIIVVASLLAWTRRYGKNKPKKVVQAQEPIHLRREQLEQLLFKGGADSGSVVFIKFLLYAGALVAAMVLLIIALPQRSMDGLVQRLEAARQSTKQSSLVNPEKLELLTLEETWSGNVLTIYGSLRNRTNEWLKGVEVVIKFYGKNGELINTLFADIDDPMLRPGKKGGFRVLYRHTYETEPLAYYELSFKLKDGTPLTHKDLRGIVQ